MSAAAKATPEAGDALLHPIALAAIALLIVNDHLLKHAFPGTWWTGKLSDFAGLTFFPLLLLASYERVLALCGRWRAPSKIAPLAIAILTGVVFALVELTESGELFYRFALGVFQAPIRGHIVAVDAYADPTDCFALTALAIPALIGSRRAS